MTWISLLVLAIFGREWIDLSAVESFAAVVTILLVGLAYAIGVLIDRVADALMLKAFVVPRPRPVDKPAGIDRMRLLVLARDDGVARFMDYQRSRMRVGRVTVLNLILL